jgi:hypothetical protein
VGRLRAGQLLHRTAQQHVARERLVPVLALGRTHRVQQLAGAAVPALGALAGGGGDLAVAGGFGERLRQRVGEATDSLVEHRVGLLPGEIAAERRPYGVEAEAFRRLTG